MDLADRISRGAVAALDLAPDDPRFSELSRQVLQGGASRFAAVVDPAEAVDYVIPVGVPEASVTFGALVVQASRVGAVWRDPHHGDRHALVTLGPDTRAAWSPVTLGGEQWARFDLDDRHTAFSFLAPPTGSPLLRTTLARALGVGAAGAAPRTQQIPVVTADPQAGPEPGQPDAVEAGVAAPPVAESAPPAAEPVVPVVEPVPLVEPVVAVVDPVTPVEAAVPLAAPRSHASAPEWAVETPVPAPSEPWAAPVPAWRPESGAPLYRDEARAPAPEPPAWAIEDTVARPVLPPHRAPLDINQPVAVAPAAPAVTAPPGRSVTVVAFVSALAATLVLGGIALAAILTLLR